LEVFCLRQAPPYSKAGFFIDDAGFVEAALAAKDFVWFYCHSGLTGVLRGSVGRQGKDSGRGSKNGYG